jgi:hypothetical protein
LDHITGALSLAGTAVGSINADHALYTAVRNPRSPLMNVPAGVAGTYTLVFAARTPAAQGLPATAYPQGDGVAAVTITTGGIVTIHGLLPDGTPVLYSNSLSKTNTFPFYITVAGGAGSISSQINFRSLATTDLDGAGAEWYLPASASALYPAGWSSGIAVDILGDKYANSVPENAASVLENVPATSSSNGNCTLTVTGTSSASNFVAKLNFTTYNTITAIPPANNLVIGLVGGRLPYNGLFTGTFTDPVTGNKDTFNGAFLQKQFLGSGFFIGDGQSGSVLFNHD